MNTQNTIAINLVKPTDALDESTIVRKVAWRIMPLIMICYLFAFFDRINISFAKFQLQSDLGLSDTAYGLGASLFVIGYVLFEIPSNIFSLQGRCPALDRPWRPAVPAVRNHEGRPGVDAGALLPVVAA